MLQSIPLSNIVFIDIETVPQQSDYTQLPEVMREYWDIKSKQIQRDGDPNPAGLYERAGIYAEFGKIVCIAAGIFSGNEFRIKSFYGHDEKQLLQDFFQMMSRHFDNPREHLLCGHNIREFDVPYLCRRATILGLELPAILDVRGKKPWHVEETMLDTMQLWRFGDYKNFTSLSLLAAVLGVPTPKDDISGADVCRVYWKENDLERIAKYCCKDVLTVAQIFRRFRNEKLLQDAQVVFVN